MIVRQFINWVRTAPAGERAEATRALARAWLISDLSEDDRAAAEGALLMLLDDSSPLVRQAMAEVFARSADVPASIVAALSVDQPSVAIPILEHSPLLIDADLVDIVATGNPETQCAIARRTELPPSVSAAIAEVGCASAALELIENRAAALAPFSIDRIVERHGHLAAIREALLALDDLPAPTRLALAERLSSTLAHFVAAREWLNPDRAHRAASEALERSTVNVAAQSRGKDMAALVKHLRTTGQLNAGLVLRALLSGNLDLFEEALVELSGLARNRVSALVHDRSAVSINALLAKAGMPESTYPAFRAALEAAHEIGFVGTIDSATRLRRRMVERVLTQCEQGPAAQSLLILLRRFATESAREEARLYCDELVAAMRFPDSVDVVDEPAEELIFAEPLETIEPYSDVEMLAFETPEASEAETGQDDEAALDDEFAWDTRREPVFDDYASFDGCARQDNDDQSMAA
ncbi:MAG: DUF2336 domain-containing protein [Rhizobiales bacterium]|nr:DUF2336 domain-containing protein [Hyphomicrobiales bacterium]